MERLLKRNEKSADSRSVAQAVFVSASRETESPDFLDGGSARTSVNDVLVNSISNSVSMVAQRRKLRAMFGRAIQLQDFEYGETMSTATPAGETVQKIEQEAISGKFLVDDHATPGPGQVNKSFFLEELRKSVKQEAEQILIRIGQTAEDCPYIPYWFNYYGDKDIPHIEAAMGRYAPGALDAADWKTCIAQVAGKVRQGFQKHVVDGSLEGVPEELPKDLVREESAQKSEEVAQMCCCGSDDENAGAAQGGRVDWDNAEVVFYTRNTRNNLGNSRYTVTAKRYQRHAPVNTYDAPREVDFDAPRHFVYLANGSDAYNAVMRSQDADVHIVRIEGGNVVMNIAGNEHRARIRPQAGDCPFDFDYDAEHGTISHGHVGHELYL